MHSIGRVDSRYNNKVICESSVERNISGSSNCRWIFHTILSGAMQVIRFKVEGDGSCDSTTVDVLDIVEESLKDDIDIV